MLMRYIKNWAASMLDVTSDIIDSTVHQMVFQCWRGGAGGRKWGCRVLITSHWCDFPSVSKGPDGEMVRWDDGSWWVDGLMDWLVDGFMGCRFDCLMVWWFLVVWWFDGLMVRLVDGSWWFVSLTVWWLLVAWWFDSLTVWWFLVGWWDDGFRWFDGLMIWLVDGLMVPGGSEPGSSQSHLKVSGWNFAWSGANICCFCWVKETIQCALFLQWLGAWGQFSDTNSSFLAQIFQWETCSASFLIENTNLSIRLGRKKQMCSTHKHIQRFNVSRLRTKILFPKRQKEVS